MPTNVAVVTGAGKGIGLSIVKGLCERYEGVVYLTTRSEQQGKAAVEQLENLGLRPKYYQLDVADRDSVKRFRDHVIAVYGGMDILINNAAIADMSEDSYEDAKMIIDINYKSLLTMQEFLYPLLRMNGRVLNISSDCGHLSNVKDQYWAQRLSNKLLTLDDVNDFVEWFLEGKRNGTFDKRKLADEGSIPAYRVSKVAMSAVTVVQQRELLSKNISVNSMHPGYVQTDMTWGLGFLSPDEAAKTPIYLVLEAPQDLKGAYVWHNGEVRDWFDYKADYYFKRRELVKSTKVLTIAYVVISVFLSYCKKRFVKLRRCLGQIQNEL